MANDHPDIVKRFMAAFRKASATWDAAFTDASGRRADQPSAPEIVAIGRNMSASLRASSSSASITSTPKPAHGWPISRSRADRLVHERGHDEARDQSRATSRHATRLRRPDPSPRPGRPPAEPCPPAYWTTRPRPFMLGSRPFNDRPRPIPARRREEGGPVRARTPQRGVARGKSARHSVSLGNRP